MTGRNSRTFLVRLWGVRGSIPAPGATTVRYGGETTCMEVRIGERVLIIDCGTGIRHLGAAMSREGVRDVDLLLTHTHLDHVCGLPFFAPAYDKDVSVRFWAGHLGAEEGTLEDVLKRMMSPPIFPMSVCGLTGVTFNAFSPGDRLPLGGSFTVDTMLLNHPGGAIAYRISCDDRVFCTVTDHEHGNPEIDARLADFVAGADAMIYDTMYTEQEYQSHVGWGHSTWEKCLDLAERADVRMPILFHHDPDRTDDELDRLADVIRKRHGGAMIAHQGLELSL
ncbi:phosphoribosyl 1,2-cyclic phosphodiesterase [Rhodobium orientis]|uniref:MBL fold metallo-hydrolase n=1 Tax=Rhodobium orientis TaxID=34017 RepID=A0A327JK19_9HYPH|nr:MBL fold metallo-hydrolase [Rhodobium orientis]MBB4305082.1 phosphoribosyl 1,2-cyclic phosphodiesterase [Rhodobium orientis]MBK5948604.1 MBL fold metallo-hydrolase [Rhodobium orientis]RAI25633.1 MBL fold metallo-hydrolase [Rhodobium orientis]